MDKKSLLEWYIAAGVDETIGDTPRNYFAEIAAPKPEIAKPISVGNSIQHTPSAAQALARELANQAKNLAELEASIRAFDGCMLKKTANKTVFADGNPRAQVMIIGEAPGMQEDREGIPFCGPSGALLDKMFATIGLNRAKSIYISNTVYWRPPGNRQPSVEETTICLPFVEKHIALIAPKLLILAGGTATNTLLAKDQSISKLRGKFYDYRNPYLSSPLKTALIYHPSYLLRTPGQKRLAWQDMLMIKNFLESSQL